MYVQIKKTDDGRDYGTQINEVRTIQGHTYATLNHGNALLVRKARQDYPEAGIAKGDVYVEHLVNGSHDAGVRYTVAEAVALGYLFVDEPMFNYYGPERGMEPVA